MCEDIVCRKRIRLIDEQCVKVSGDDLSLSNGELVYLTSSQKELHILDLCIGLVDRRGMVSILRQVKRRLFNQSNGRTLPT